MVSTPGDLDTVADDDRVIPFAAVVAPGSLLVQPSAAIYVTPLQVPQPFFNITAYAQMGGDADWEVDSAVDAVSRLAYVTAMSAQPLSLSSAHQNESYHLTFHGPAIQCESANSSVQHQLMKAVNGTVNNTYEVRFVSWVGGDAHKCLSPSGYVDSTCTSGDVADWQILDLVSEDAAHIFFYSDPSFNWPNVMVTDCSLHNTTYEVRFDFEYPGQTTTISISKSLNPVSAESYQPAFREWAYLTNATASAIGAYDAIMAAFGSILVGTASRDRYGHMKTWSTNYAVLAIDWSDEKAMRRGLEELFQNITLSMLSDSSLMYSLC